MTPALTPTTGYFVATRTSGRSRSFGAESVSSVPFGWLTSVHFMSKAHSMVLPAMTELSAATLSAKSGGAGIAASADASCHPALPVLAQFSLGHK
jgi:hypothetical protein